ncbi:ABC transporter permease [Micromonospora sp. 067-2]|uniref:ABC transporter permease n=1 Tax=Micromonospora sp. 067-2 TaxID=2789270 RepID=UPI00397BDB06
MTQLATAETAVPVDAAAARARPHWIRPKSVVGGAIILAVTLFALLGPLVVQDPHAVSSDGLTGPSAAHLLGTTNTGTDVLAQLAHGARGSLTIGLLVAVLITILTSLFGVVGAYAGGFVDDAFSLLSNVLLVIPGLPLMIIIGAYVQHKSLWMVALVIALTGWAGGARVLRAQTLSLRSRDYVSASRVAGEKLWRVLLVEIFPNLLPVLSSGFVFGVVGAILAEAGLSYIGIGASDSITWGTMLADAQAGQALLLGAWWWFVPPGVLIAIFGCGFALVNFALDEVINPRLRTYRMPRQARQEHR